MSHIKVFEQPTAHIRWVSGILQQRWRLVWRDDDTSGAANPETEEWRDVPVEVEQQDAGEEVNDFYARGEHISGVTR